MIRVRWRSIFLVLTALYASVLYVPSLAIGASPVTVLTFDDIVANGMGVAIPTGYGGVSWPSNMGINPFQDAPYLPKSPPNHANFDYHDFSSGVVENVVTFIDGPKIFDGAYFAGRHDVYLNLYRGGALVGTSSVLSLGSASGPFFLASGYTGPVDAVGIVLDRLQVGMDNFTFHDVPEPSTVLLLGIGAISLLGYRKAKSHG